MNNINNKFDKREVATFILVDMFNENAYSNIVLRKTLSNYDKICEVSKSDKGFVVEVVNGTIRNLMYIDYIINEISKTNTKKMKPFILNLLRTTVYQLVFMDNSKVHVCCNEAVNLAKKKGFTNLSGFVNGVLRNIARQKEEIQKINETKNKVARPLEYLSIRYSFPMWLLKYWHGEMNISIDELENMCTSLNEPSKVSLVVNTNKISLKNLQDVLIHEDIEIVKTDEKDNTIIVKGTGNITNLNSFKEGYFHVMNKSSVFAVNLAGVKEGDCVLDTCSAPGGKSFLMAYNMKNKGSITSLDIYEHKIELIEQGLKRLGIDIIDAKIQDATEINEEFINKFDIVLVDAPCSGFGIINKKPDIKYNKIYDDMKELAKLQKSILDVCSKYVKKNGVLVYSTCTISKRENEDNVKWFLENYDFEIENPDNSLKNYVQIMPTEEYDGFFIAKFRKIERK